ncbi:MAG: hypothetical protein IJ238_00825, partial [Acidaminococcaceae bacterium]|nr:hypothetical protein [Acidaminococcaceae bacterium]
ASRVRTVSLSSDVDGSRVRKAQGEGDYGSRVRKVQAADETAMSEEARVRNVSDPSAQVSSYGSPSAPYGSEAAAGRASSSDVKAAGTSSAGTEPSASNEAASSNGNASAGAYVPDPDIPMLQAPAGSGAQAAAVSKYPNSKLPMSTNMPIGSIYYDYLEKLDGMGYLKSMLYGTRPYSRMDMARWTLEAREASKSKPDATDFVETMISRLEKALAPEIAQIRGGEGNAKTSFKLHSTSVELAATKLHNKDGYGYRGPANARWQSFSTNNKGHKYEDGGNMIVGMYASGNLGWDTALSVSGRAAWDKEDVTASLDEAYLATRVGIWNIEAGKQAIAWGQGVTGNFLFSDNARPRTMLKISNEEQPQSKGFLKFLGKTRFTAFASRLDGDRTENGVHDYEHPYLLGFRGDFTYKNFTLGLARASMLGGKGNAFHKRDLGKWLVGKNANHDDKWNDIAGVDFRWRMPGVTLYGELYGEDQAGYSPSLVAYRGGIYIPRLSYDGTWDMRLEGAHTNRSWYSHGTYRAGWTYRNDIMGDYMGTNATRLYANLNYYASAFDKVGFHGSYWTADQADNTKQKVKNAWLTYDKVLGDNDTLNFMAGLSDIRRGGKYGFGAKDKIVRVIWEHQY